MAEVDRDLDSSPSHVISDVTQNGSESSSSDHTNKVDDEKLGEDEDDDDASKVQGEEKRTTSKNVEETNGRNADDGDDDREDDGHIDRKTYDKLLAEKKRLNDELKRLKDHLITVEDEYTQEILSGEQRENQAKDELAKAMETVEQLKAKLSETDQSANWSERMEALKAERDKALENVSKLDDKVHRLTASVTNLQLVIEQMQKENEKKLSSLSKQHQATLEAERAIQSDLRKEVELHEKRSLEAAQALQAATRLTENIDKKEEMIQNLKLEISEKDGKIIQLEKEIQDLKSSFEGKVDKQIIKNLVLAYFGTPLDKKHEVERLLARILDFNQEEMTRAGLTLTRSSGKLAGLNSASGHHSQSSSDSSTTAPGSLSKMFIEFLENESKPRAPLTTPNTLTRELARDLTKAALTPNSKGNSSNIFFDKSPLTSKLNSNNSLLTSSLLPSGSAMTASINSPAINTPSTASLLTPYLSTTPATPTDNHLLLVEPSVSTLSPIKPVSLIAPVAPVDGSGNSVTNFLSHQPNHNSLANNQHYSLKIKK